MCRVLASLDAKNPRFLAYCDDLKLHLIVFTSLQSRYIIIDAIKGLKGICMQIRYGNISLEMSATLEKFPRQFWPSNFGHILKIPKILHFYSDFAILALI